MASQDWLEKDFYQILGVSKDVSDAELKKVYRKLARKYHPDSNPGDAAAEAKFKEISEAFSVLSDKEQRSEYDQIRAMGAGGARFTSGGQGFEDIFGGMFGGGMGGAGAGGQRFTFQQGGGAGGLHLARRGHQRQVQGRLGHLRRAQRQADQGRDHRRGALPGLSTPYETTKAPAVAGAFVMSGALSYSCTE